MAFQEEHIPYILLITGMTRSQYNTLFFEQGIEYLKREANYDEWGVSMVSKHPMFWAWWKNVWYNCDSDIMPELKRIRTHVLNDRLKRDVREAYRKIHDAERMKLHPPKFIISAAYEKLIVDMKNAENHV